MEPFRIDETPPAAPVFSGRLPLFPLPETVLFPGQTLPLHVFEPRYRALLRAALAGERLIGMALLKSGWEKDYEGTPPVHPVVGVGRVEDHRRLADGRYDIVLSGEARARVLSETRPGLYRLAAVEVWVEPADAASVEPGLLGQLETVCRLLVQDRRLPAEALRRLKPADQPLGRLVDRLTALAPLTADERQSVLEALDVRRRAETLLHALGRRLRGFLSPVEAGEKR